jgi:hypothetical protein
MVREQIMALPCPYHNASDEWYAWETGVEQAADIAEAREKELLAEKAALIAELRGLPRYCLQSSTALDEVLDKYEAKP